MTALPSDILDFIARHVGSAAALDVLLLFRRSPDTFWAPAAVAEKLGIHPEVADTVVSRFHAAGLLARASSSSAFRFAPGRPSDRACIDALAACCDDSRTAVLDAIRARRASSQTDGDGVRA